MIYLISLIRIEYITNYIIGILDIVSISDIIGILPTLSVLDTDGIFDILGIPYIFAINDILGIQDTFSIPDLNRTLFFLKSLVARVFPIALVYPDNLGIIDIIGYP